MSDELLAVGSSFRGYVILRKIGAGGTGEVYLARHLTLGVNTAVKVLKREVVECSREARTRFSREVRTLARIRNPALVAIHDVGFDDATGLYFIVMDYLPGGTVADELKRVHRFSVKKALRIVRSVADGLLALERKGFVHRDVKPDNMLIAEDGSVRLYCPCPHRHRLGRTSVMRLSGRNGRYACAPVTGGSRGQKPPWRTCAPAAEFFVENAD